MTLSFSSDDPSQYVDCGHMKASSIAGSVDDSYVGYLVSRFGGRLEGKINILVKDSGKNSTLVRVHVRYVFSTQPGTNYRAQSWVFESGGKATVAVQGATQGTIPTRTCVPTHELERQILESLDR